MIIVNLKLKVKPSLIHSWSRLHPVSTTLQNINTNWTWHSRGRHRGNQKEICIWELVWAHGLGKLSWFPKGQRRNPSATDLPRISEFIRWEDPVFGLLGIYTCRPPTELTYMEVTSSMRRFFNYASNETKKMHFCQPWLDWRTKMCARVRALSCVTLQILDYLH